MSKNPPNKALQKFQLLTSDTEFMSDIYSLRKKWNIPENGFKGNTGGWHENIMKKSDDVMNGKKYNDELYKIWQRKKNLGKKDNGDNWKKIEEDNKKVQRLIPINEFTYALSQLRAHYQLSRYYENYLRNFLFFNNTNLFVPCSNLIIKEGKDENEEQFLYLQIFAETTTKDILKAWKLIEIHQKRLRGYKKGRFKKVIKIDRNKRICELAEQGKNINEIGEIIREEFPGEKPPYEYISKIKGNFKRKIRKEKMDT